MGKALDKVRASEAKRLKEEGQEVILKGSRWCFLKRKFNLTKSQDKLGNWGQVDYNLTFYI